MTDRNTFARAGYILGLVAIDAALFSAVTDIIWFAALAIIPTLLAVALSSVGLGAGGAKNERFEATAGLVLGVAAFPIWLAIQLLTGNL